VGLLTGKKALITGVANKRSIAWGIASAFHREGAELAFTYAIERLRGNVEELVATLPDPSKVPVFPCDVSRQEEIDAGFAKLGEAWGKLDVLVHAIGFAPIDDLKGRFVDTTRDGMKVAHDVSAFSLIALAKAAQPLFAKAGGGSVMSLSFDAVNKVVPNYNAMAVAKAGLETATRYLACDLGPEKIRVNCISAGAIKTIASSAVKGISTLREQVELKSPLRRNVTLEELGDVGVFLASDMSRCITGATIFADSGFNLLGASWV
jgi:enoyl-[acyl-carrier protein] reductase I